MSLTETQQQEFDENGYLIFPSLFSAEEIELLRSQLPNIFSEDNTANIREKQPQEISMQGMIVLCGASKTQKTRKLLLQAVDLGILCFGWDVKLILSYKNYF